jgi:hypothetical protein
MKRKRFTESEVLKTLLLQGAVIPCGICRKAFFVPDVVEGNIHRDHDLALALEGSDKPENCRYVHASPCHSTKTNGSPATSYGSDKHIIAKGKRIRGETKKRPKRKIPSRPFPRKEGKTP